MRSHITARVSIATSVKIFLLLKTVVVMPKKRTASQEKQPDKLCVAAILLTNQNME